MGSRVIVQTILENLQGGLLLVFSYCTAEKCLSKTIIMYTCYNYLEEHAFIVSMLCIQSTALYQGFTALSYVRTKTEVNQSKR